MSGFFNSSHRILAAADFMAAHTPPLWLIEGIVQRGRLYACTSVTGHGKTAVWLFNGCMICAGRQIGNLTTHQGNVLFLAGENPTDLEARMLGMLRAYGLDKANMPYVLPGAFPLNQDEADGLKREIDSVGVDFTLIIGDTAASFFPGDDENDNVQAGQYARTLRGFADCSGNPAVVVLSHPVKNFARANLLPRGGGAFLNELDGNLTLWSDIMGELTELGWQGKIRGPDFPALGYTFRKVRTGLFDELEQPEMTIIAEPMTDDDARAQVDRVLANEDVVLTALRDHPDWSFTQIARDAGWIDSETDRPMKERVNRAIVTLAEDKLVQQLRRGAKWTLTQKGRDALTAGEPL